MGEETSDAMNLDLNLGPVPEPLPGSVTTEHVSFDDWMEDPLHRISFGEPFRLRSSRHRWTWRQVHIPPEAHNISVELNQFLLNPGSGSGMQVGEGSMAAEERTEDVPKACENNNGVTEDETSEKKDHDEKGTGNDGSFFDCNICLDLARDPVVTCCGHLFCWSCLYRWLDVYSDAKECPICKGEVTSKNITPIYGRGNPVLDPDENSILKIPPRPRARRVESFRQAIQRSTLALPVEEMIRHLGSRSDRTRDVIQPHEPDNVRETADRISLLNRLLTSRGMRRDHVGAPAEDLDLGQNNLGSTEAGDDGRPQPFLIRRAQRTTLSSLSSALSSAERFFEAYFRNHPMGRNLEQPPAVDDTDSFSSIAAVINSESQVDTAVEIDSMVSLSTSSSRRRNDTSRVSDVDSGDSRAPRRRRMN